MESEEMIMAEVLVVGPSSWNQLVSLDSLPEPRPHMVFAHGAHETVGGTSAGKALHLVELGCDVELATVLGDDDEGRRVEAALRGAGVPLLLERATPTERHLNLMAADGGRVSIYLAVPPEPVRGALDAVVAAMAGARALVLDLSPRAAALLDDARATGIPIWTDLHDFDGRSEFHQPFLAAAQYVFCNADRLDDPVAFLHSVVSGTAVAGGAEADGWAAGGRARGGRPTAPEAAGGVRVAVCTLGADGAVAVDAELGELRVSAEPVDRIVDTNGAGDGFTAGFLAATLDGADTESALRAGARQAARALTSPHLSRLLDHVS